MDTLSLQLFNERVDRLDRCSLAKRMDENPHYQLNYEKMINRQWVSIDGISEDEIDSFVLNVRLLIQDNDGFSIRCLEPELSCSSGTSHRTYTPTLMRHHGRCFLLSPRLRSL